MSQIGPWLLNNPSQRSRCQGMVNSAMVGYAPVAIEADYEVDLATQIAHWIFIGKECLLDLCALRLLVVELTTSPNSFSTCG